MADGKFLIGKPAGGVTTVTVIDGASNTNLVLPESGTVASVDTVVTDNAIARYNGTTGKLQNSTVIVDDSGNVGIGVTPNAWHYTTKALQLGTVPDSGVLFSSIGINHSQVGIGANFYYDSWFTPRYVSSYPASMYQQTNGAHIWHTAPSGTAGNAITWTNAMTLDSSGHLLVGQTSGTSHAISGNNYATGLPIIQFGGDGTTNAVAFFAINQQSWSISNAAATAIRVGNSATGRSINASGTINASGADYAEYEYSNDITIAKGQIVGFKEDGTLTDKYVEAIRFAIKSTNPSIVGGDTWGIEDIVGKRPEQPVRKLDKTEQVQIDGSEEFETVVIEAGDTDAEWEIIEAPYKIELAEFEARLEAERQKVDRIAYAGKVPVNVYGATAGQYIVAIDKDGVIDGLAVNKADMTFARYQDAVGRVNKILYDGRAEVAVIIH